MLYIFWGWFRYFMSFDSQMTARTRRRRNTGRRYSAPAATWTTFRSEDLYDFVAKHLRTWSQVFCYKNFRSSVYGQHGGSIISIVVSQILGLNCGPGLFFVWSLHVLPMSAWVFSECSGFLPQTKDMSVRLIGNSKLPLNLSIFIGIVYILRSGTKLRYFSFFFSFLPINLQQWTEIGYSKSAEESKNASNPSNG